MPIRPLALFALALLAPLLAAASTVPPERVARLATGINLSHWFSQVHPVENYTIAHLKTHTDAADIDAIAGAGFTHVRLPVDPLRFLEDGDPARIRGDWLAELDRALVMILERDLAVIVDLHAFGSFIDRMKDDDEQVARIATLWTAMLATVAQHDPERVFVEVMNEPKLNDAARWRLIAGRLHGAIRAAAPEHTIILSGKHFSGAGDLAAFEPVDDGNVIYNFHFYEPMIFTHQAAHWAWWPWKHCANVPYPSDPELLRPVVDATDNDRAKGLLREYGQQRWDRARLATIVDEAASWAEQHQVALTCNEFGVFTKASPRDSRLRWTTDAVSVFEERGIGWSMWDYQGGFDLKLGEAADGTPELDQAMLTALGLAGAE